MIDDLQGSITPPDVCRGVETPAMQGKPPHRSGSNTGLRGICVPGSIYFWRNGTAPLLSAFFGLSRRCVELAICAHGSGGIENCVGGQYHPVSS